MSSCEFCARGEEVIYARADNRVRPWHNIDGAIVECVDENHVLVSVFKHDLWAETQDKDNDKLDVNRD